MESYILLEADGTVVEPGEYAPKNKKAGKLARRVPLPQEPGERKSEDRTPKDRERQEQYKGNNVKGNNVEKAPVPFSEKRETILVDCSGEPENQDGISAPPDIRKLVSALIHYGKQERRDSYEKLLSEQIFPGLADSTPPERCDQAASLEFCRRSIKAEVILSISTDSSWNGQLARSFAKGGRRFSDGDFRIFLLGHDWKREVKSSLVDLVKASHPKDGKWSKFLSAAKIRYGSEKMSLAGWREDVDNVEGNDHHWTRVFTRNLIRQRSAGLVYDDSSPREKFNQVLYLQLAASGKLSAHAEQTDLNQLSDKLKKWKQAIEQHIVSDKIAAEVFSSLVDSNLKNFDINLRDLGKLHSEWLERSNLRCELYDIAPYDGFGELFDAPLDIDFFAASQITKSTNILPPF